MCVMHVVFAVVLKKHSLSFCINDNMCHPNVKSTANLDFKDAWFLIKYLFNVFKTIVLYVKALVTFRSVENA